MNKIVLIGAGSAVFTRGLVADLILFDDLGPWELGLVDPDPVALETAEGLSRKMVEARGAGDRIAIRASADRRELLPGATVVVSTVGVGGRRAWETDVAIPRKYGVFQPVGDSVLPGGISRAMRVIPVLVDVANDVRTLCPDAWFFNYANPMTANCWAIREATGVPVVGLCHGLFHVERQLAEFLGAPPEEMTSLYAGLNHLTFVFDLRWNGEDAWPLVREKLAAERRANPEERSRFLGQTFAEGFAAADNPFAWSLFDAYGAYPAVNDRHVVEFFPERFPGGAYHGLTLGVDAFSHAEIVAWGDDRYAAMRHQALGEDPLDESIFDRTAGEHEQLLHILRSIKRDERGVFSVNVPNRGAVPNLPSDAVLELPAAATATGLRPLQIPDFPDTLAAVVVRKLAAVRLTVEAALTGDRRLFVEALLADGAVTDRAVATTMGEELLAAQRQYLPRFF
ncbi:MAG: GH4 [uncultured Thermomicrobiales bacterium]|uniref:GH4 n=1 Tax=uncultured Thermomicrobiales bacterium TaxID=1645740 RepID=A0A6J4TQW8_9BACT|nr:MAG: GH4 [uncultured Thermomicrobiales bacterium]